MKNKDRRWLTAPIILVILGILGFIFPGYTYLAAIALAFAAICCLYHFSRKKARRIYTAVILLGVIVFGIVEIPIIADARTDAPADCEYIIVLGAGLFGTSPSLSLRTRLEAARDYLLANPDSLAIVSGGQGPGEDITEGEAMGLWLEGQGIAPERIIKEELATNTSENLANSFAIIRSRGGDPEGSAVVSSIYHLYRAKYLAAEQGVTVYGVASPIGYPLVTLNYFVREGCGRLYYWVFGTE